jgi:hypothetical protein
LPKKKCSQVGKSHDRYVRRAVIGSGSHGEKFYSIFANDEKCILWMLLGVKGRIKTSPSTPAYCLILLLLKWHILLKYYGYV